MAQMLDAVSRLVGDRLFEDVSVDEIAAEAGVTKGAFYKRCSNTRDIFLLLHERAISEARERWRAFLAPERWESASADRLLDPLVDRVIEAHEGRTRLMRAFSFEARWGTHPKVREAAQTLNRQIRDDVVRRLRGRPGVRFDAGLTEAVTTALLVLRTTLTEALLFVDVGTGPAPPPAVLGSAMKSMLRRYLLEEG